VWSTKIASAVIPASAPSAPSATWARSSSLPTQAKTSWAPRAASRGVAAAAPPNSSTQRCALAAVRL